MSTKNQGPIKDLFASAPLIDSFRFISTGATDTITIHAIDKYGNVQGVYSPVVGTTAKTAKQLADSVGANIASHAWWLVTAISGTVYALTGSAVTVTASNGWALTVDDQLGQVPATGTVIQSTNPAAASVSVSSSALPTGASTAANQTTQITAEQAIQTSVELIDDVVSTDDTTTHTPATTKALNVGFVADDTATDSVNEGDIGMARMTLDRRQRIANKCIDGPGEPTVDSYSHVAINLTTGADQVLVSSAANKQIWVYGFAFVCGDAAGQTVSLQDEDNVAITGIMEFSQYGGITNHPSGNFAMPLFKLGTDKDLEVDITGGDVDGWLCYALVSV